MVKLNVFILNCYYNNLKYHDAIIANVKLPKIISIIYNDEYSMNSTVQTTQQSTNNKHLKLVSIDLCIFLIIRNIQLIVY